MVQLFRNINRGYFTSGTDFSNAFTPKDLTACRLWLSGDRGVTTHEYFSSTTNLNTSWTNDCSPSTAGQADPFQGTNAFLLNDESAATYRQCAQSKTVPATAVSYNIDLYVKKNVGGKCCGWNFGFSGGNALNSSVRFNPDTGATASVSASAVVTDLGTGWWLLRCVIANDGTNNFLTCAFFPATGTTVGADSAAVTGSQTVYLPSLKEALGKVDNWLDLTGRGNSVAQATVANQPTYNVNPLNGLPTLRFRADGYTWLLNTSKTDLAPANVTISAVARYTTEQAISYIAGRGDTGFGGYWLAFLSQIPTGDFGNGAADIRPTGAATTVNTWNVVTAKYDGAAGTTTKNGTAGTPLSMTGALDYTVSGGGNPSFYVGQTSGESSARTLTGDVAEVTVYSGALSTINQRRLEKYLGRKYALTVA